jgi:hypothetical protein
MPLHGIRRTPMGARTTALAIGALAVTMVLTAGLTAGPVGASKASNLAAAKKALLVHADLPKGWTSSGNTSTGHRSFPGEAQLAACIGVPVKTVSLNPPTVSSPNFENKAQTLTVDDSIAVYSSAAVATQQYAAMTNPKTPGCMANILNGPEKSEFDSSFGAGTTVGTVTAKDGSTANFAKHTTALVLSFTVVSAETTIPVTVTQLVFVKGAEGQQIGFTAIGATFPKSLTTHLTRVALGRL